MKIKKKFFGIFLATIAILFGAVGSFYYFSIQNPTSLAYFSQDDNSGQWQLTFQNNAGLEQNQGVTIDHVNATATVQNGASGSLFTSVIRPASFYSWTNLSIVGTWSDDNDVKLQLYTCGATPQLLPNNA